MADWWINDVNDQLSLLDMLVDPNFDANSVVSTYLLLLMLCSGVVLHEAGSFSLLTLSMSRRWEPCDVEGLVGEKCCGEKT